MVDRVDIDLSAGKEGPSLEEQAKAMGIDVEGIDETAQEQTAKEPAQKILGKFESVDALTKAYQELEKKLSGSKTAEPAAEEVVEEEASEEDQGSDNDQSTEEEDAAKEAVEKAGLDFNELSNKYWDQGSLDDSDYEALEKTGVPKAYVDQFIEGQQAIIELTRQAVFKEAGSEETYFKMVDWAKENYSEAEATLFNQQVDGRDPTARSAAIRGLKARYEAVKGKEPTRTFSGGRGGDTTVYQSTEQMLADMAKPEYKKDPAFRQKVQNKLARSNIL